MRAYFRNINTEPKIEHHAFLSYRKDSHRFHPECDDNCVKMIKKGIREEDPPSWGMIEVQGDVEARNQTPLENEYVGDLHFAKQGDTPILIIGHHILHGKAVKMEKPFAVLEKQKSADGSTEYIVKAMVKHKLLFKTRPKPIIANVPKVQN